MDGDPLGSIDPEGLQTRPGIRPWENMPVGGGGGAAGGRVGSGAGSTGGSRPVVPVPPIPIPIPDKEIDRDIWWPDKKPEKWVCKARADCNDNIPGNYPPDLKKKFSFGGGEANDLGSARNIAKSNATSNLQCQPKHVSCKCTGPKGERYSGGVLKMAPPLQIGTKVRLLGVPDWLIHDLPKSERMEIVSLVGKLAAIQEIDKYGYVWLGFGSCSDAGDATHYSGHSFAVPPEFVEIVNP